MRFKKGFIISAMIWSVLQPSLLPFLAESSVYAAEKKQEKQQEAAEDKRLKLAKQYGVSEEDIQSILNQGYTLDEAEQAFKRKMETGRDLIQSLNEVNPKFVNNSAEVESTVSGDVYVPEASAAEVIAAEEVVQTVNTKPSEAPYMINSEYESVSTVSGGLSLQATDMTISSRNGLSFALTRTYDSNNAQTEYNIRRLGFGWNWDLPYISGEFLHLAGGLGSGAYRMHYENEDGCTSLGCPSVLKLKGYPYANLKLYTESNYKVVQTLDGTKYYFGFEGLLEKISDVYNNTLEFSYTNTDYSRWHDVNSLSSIKSDTGQTITISDEAQGLVITKGEQQVKLLKKQFGNERYFYIAQAIDPEGRVTTYDYKIGAAYKDYSDSSTDTYAPYLLLTGVTHPTGAKSVYVYESSPTEIKDPNTALQFVNEAYRVQEKYLTATLMDGTSKIFNRQSYSYFVPADSYRDMTISTTVDDGLSKTKFTYDKVLRSGIYEEIPVYYNTNTTKSASYNNITYTISTDYTHDRARLYFIEPINEKITYSASGQSIEYTSSRQYDSYGNVLSSTNPLGVTTNYAYEAGLLRSVTEPITDTQKRFTLITRNAQKKVIKEQVYDGSESGTLLSEKTYEDIDAYGNTRKITSKTGTAKSSVVTIEYADAYQNRFPTKTKSTVTDADGKVSTVVNSYEYNSNTGQVTKLYDGKNAATTYQYDLLGRIIKVTNPDNSTSLIQYNDTNNSLQLTDETGVQTYTQWNPIGWKILAGFNEKLIKAKMGYDDYGRLAWTEDAKGNRTTYGYDQWSRQNKVTAPDGTYSTVETNDVGLTKTTTDATGYKVTEILDKLGRVTEQKETKKVIVNGQSTDETTVLSTSIYDYAGQVREATDALANKTKFDYDTIGRLISVTNAKQEVTKYDYSASADSFNQMSIVYPDGKVRTKKLDELNRAMQLTAPGGEIEKYYYDANGNREKFKNRNGYTYQSTFNNRNWMAKQDILAPDGQVVAGDTVSYTYDKSGRRLSMNDMTGTTSYAYDPSTGGLSKITYPDGRTIQYNYDVLGNLQDYKDPFDVNVYYSYDALNRMTSVGQTAGSTLTGSPYAQYSYYANSQLKQIKQSNGVTTDYTYEGPQLKTLINKTSTGTVLHNYTYIYDKNSNQTSINTDGQTASFSYDQLNRISTSNSKEKSDVEFAETGYNYDQHNRLTSLTANGQTVSYKYNGDGLLWERTKNGETSRYYYNGDQVIAEATVSAAGEVEFKARYLRGLGLAAMDNGQMVAYYLHNGHGDVTELRDSTGTTRLNEYSYDIWGNPLVSNESITNPFRYSGEMWDNDAKLQYLRARWYDPSVGRFISEDSYEGDITNPLTLNLYSYTANNPLRFIDPSGHDYELPSAGRLSELAQSSWYTGAVNYFFNSFSINQYSGYDGLLNGMQQYNLELLKTTYAVADSSMRSVMEIQGLALRNDGCSYLDGGCQGGTTSITASGDGYLNIDLYLDGEVTSYAVVQLESGPVQFECNCFTAGTKVLTSDGEKPIEEINVGDKVLAKDDKTGEMAYKEVVSLFQKQADEIFYLHIGGEVIEVTGEHPFWLDDKGWTLVKDLKVNDLLVTSDGRKISIDKIEKEPREATVYNFEVKDFNSYFVSNLGIWVHNCQVGTYTITFQSGTVYHGKGPISRMDQSAKERSLANNDPVITKVFTPAANVREALMEEARRIRDDGGPGKGNYNRINSPGKKILEEEERRRQQNGGY
ncbi:polymorphic toxin-type HINT domain-containing protein [Paenibacillus sp. S-38]|uniref:polymorphic toxin-type HINT domain-containing protein n=1 Tax=Paenibacillus sp. S-38 TaxID=3416710 RepID=UPI003CEF04B8